MKANAQHYTNVVNRPLIIGDDDTLLIDKINIPGLHVMTGNTGKLLQEMEKTFPDQEEGKNFVDKFLATMNVHRAEYQGSHSFEGNQARKLLRRIAHRCLKLLSTMMAMNGDGTNESHTY